MEVRFASWTEDAPPRARHLRTCAGRAPPAAPTHLLAPGAPARYC